MAERFIHAKDLTFSYPGEGDRRVPVLKGISLDIDRGEYVAILGHNGSGKSTFAKLLNLILEPEGGELVVAGKTLSDPDALTDDDVYELRRAVGMVFQNPDNQLIATIVEDDVAFGPEYLGVPSREIRRRVDEALAAVGMSDYARREPHRLSGGQKQRVAIAGILAMLPDCMIFDEATAMLDPVGRREVIETFERLHRERGITVLTITHDMSEAARADRVIVFDDGHIRMDGTPRAVFARTAELAATGLDVPPCTALAEALRREGIALPGTPLSAEECAELLLDAWREQTQRKEPEDGGNHA